MKISEYYEQNKPHFEICAALLVLAGLMLNLPKEAGLIGKSLNHIQFLLLMSSAIYLWYLLKEAFVSVVFKKILADTQESLSDFLKFEFKLIFFLSFFVMFIVDFSVFLFIKYSSETIATLILLVLMSALYVAAKAINTKVIPEFIPESRPLTQVGVMLIQIIFIGVAIEIPIISFYYFYFGTENIKLIIEMVALVYVAELIGYFWFAAKHS